MQPAEATHSIQLYPTPSMNINKFCKKLLFREKVVRTESRKDKTMFEAWQSLKKPFSGIISVYKYVCGIKTGHSFKDIFSSSSLAHIPWKQKCAPGCHLRLTGTYQAWVGPGEVVSHFSRSALHVWKEEGTGILCRNEASKGKKIQKNQLSNKNVSKA